MAERSSLPGSVSLLTYSSARRAAIRLWRRAPRAASGGVGRVSVILRREGSAMGDRFQRHGRSRVRRGSGFSVRSIRQSARSKATHEPSKGKRHSTQIRLRQRPLRRGDPGGQGRNCHDQVHRRPQGTIVLDVTDAEGEKLGEKGASKPGGDEGQRPRASCAELRLSKPSSMHHLYA